MLQIGNTGICGQIIAEKCCKTEGTTGFAIAAARNMVVTSGTDRSDQLLFCLSPARFIIAAMSGDLGEIRP